MKNGFKFLMFGSLIAAAAGSGCLNGCVGDVGTVDKPDDGAPGDGKVKIELFTKAPDGFNPPVATGTRAGMAQENEVDENPWVLVFEGTGDDATYVEAAQAYILAGKHYVDLTATDKASRLLVLANPQAGFTGDEANEWYEYTVDSFNASLKPGGTPVSLAEACAILHTDRLGSPQATVPFANTNPDEQKPLPMSGVCNASGIGNDLTIKVSLIRAVAKVVVNNSAEGFTLSGATIAGAPRRGTLYRLAEAPLKANADAADRTNYTEIAEAEENTTQANPIYVYESRREDGMFVIARGTYNGTPSFYKLSFRGHIIKDPSDSDALLDVLRNYVYTFDITSVGRAGYPTLADAIAAEHASNEDIEWEITVRDATAHDIVDNGLYYLGVSNSQYIVYADGTLTGKVAFTVTTSATEDILSSGINTIEVSGQGLSLSAAGQTITLSTGEGNVGSAEVKLNMTAGFTSGTVTLKLGDLEKVIAVSRSPAMGWRQIESAPLILPFEGDYLSAQVAEGGGESGWLGIATSNDRTAQRSDYLHTPEDGGNLYIHARPNYNESAREGGVIYLSRRDDTDGRIKLDISQSPGAEPELEVDKDAIEFNYMGSEEEFTVTTSTLGEEDIPCTVEYSLDGGVTWITAEAPVDVAEIVNSGVANPIEMDPLPCANPYSAENDKLRNSPDALGGSSEDAPVNLSTRFGEMTTANCYIINGPGWYSIPLVYGNAITGGRVNSSAYTSTASGSNVLQTLQRHDGQAIVSPFIFDNGFTPGDAVLVWAASDSDSEETGGKPSELITDVHLDNGSGSYQRLVFNIPQASIRQGNAVVAVRDADDVILWSWHIWITPLVNADPSQTTTYTTINDDGNSYDFTVYNLGWIRGPSTRYGMGGEYDQPRPEIILRITQDIEEGLTHEITLNQNPGIYEPASINPFYQWGRKDPMIPSNGNPDEHGLNANGGPVRVNDGDYHDDKPVYWGADYAGAVAEGANINIPTAGAGTVSKSIQNPHIFYTGGDGIAQDHRNLWSINATTGGNTAAPTDDTDKTVYDPCPAGFKMPASNTWTMFAVEPIGNNAHDHVYTPNSWGSWAEWTNGYRFYLTANGAETYTEEPFPASGGRHYETGALDFVDMRGHYWSSQIGRYMYIFYLNNAGLGPGISPVRGSERGRAFSVRPVRDIAPR